MAKKVRKKWLIGLVCTFVVAIGIYSGYFVGKMVSDKYFLVDKYSGYTEEMLRDDLTAYAYESKNPDDFEAPLAFQIAEVVMSNSPSYEVRGSTITNTSVGVTQKSASIDKKEGEDYYVGFTTYGSVVKVAKQCNFKEGGEVKMQNGTPTDASVENVDWSNNFDEYGWEEYKALGIRRRDWL